MLHHMENVLDDFFSLTKIEDLGKKRQAAHPNGTRRFFDDPNIEDTIGVAGEAAFAQKYSLSLDESIRPDGDGHVDFVTPIGTIDVKTARKPFNLLIKEWEIERSADIIVLAKFNSVQDIVFLGWATRQEMATMPIKDFGYGIRNYYRHASSLRPMSELDTMLLKSSV